MMSAMSPRRHEKPIRRTNPSGAIVWIARYTDRHGTRRSAGQFELRGPCRGEHEGCCAQHAIDTAYEKQTAARDRRDTIGTYAEGTWLTRHPRPERTADGYRGKMRAILDVEIDGMLLRDWPLHELRGRHVRDLVDHMLRVQGRAANGAQGVLRVLSAMFRDAKRDELVEFNPCVDVNVSAADPRVTKAPRAVDVWTWEQSHAYALRAARIVTVPPVGSLRVPVINAWRPVYAEAMIRVLSDCGLRLGELFPLERGDLKLGDRCDEAACVATGAHLHVRRTTWRGTVQTGTKTDHGQAAHGRAVPVPAGLATMLRGLPPRIDTLLLFPTPGGTLWLEQNFRDDVLNPAEKVTGMHVRPHDLRHSFVSQMRAAGVDAADLAEITGHTVATMVGHYTHAMGRSFDAVREAVGE